MNSANTLPGMILIILMIISTINALIPDKIVKEDYCKLNKNCPAPGAVHISCQLPRPKLGPTCPSDGVTFIDLNSTLMNYIVDRHNYYRNKIASGNVTGYPKAAKMLTLRWEDTLAYFSESNIRQCVMKHDSCRRTANYSFVGQNICKSYSAKLNPPEKIIDSCMTLWFLESNDVPNPGGLIDKCCTNPKPVPFQIGHFTQMVTDRIHAVGCALNTFKQNGFYYYLFACDYSNGNIIASPTYRRLQKSSECAKFNPTYKSLCHIDEKFNANATS